MSGPPDYLTTALSFYGGIDPPDNRPFVTLTFAQSLDAKIAGQNGKQLILSGKESMIMTHWMRTMHDAILVGIGTALNDDPQLNARNLPPATDGVRRNLPRPVIVDRHLQTPTSCKLLRNYQNNQGRRPWIITREGGSDGWDERRLALEEAGARVIEVEGTNTPGNRIAIEAILKALRKQGIRSLMVEGGAKIIGAFLEQQSAIDVIIVTVAPAFVGSEGVGYAHHLVTGTGTFKHARTEVVGRDSVVILTSDL